MSALLTRVPGFLPVAGPVVLAFLLAWGGLLAGRHWRRLPAIWVSVGAGAGWAGLAPVAWRWSPRMQDTVMLLVPPTIGLIVGQLLQTRFRTRWIGAGAVCLSAWWLANAPMARPQSWRVGFGVLVVTWLLGKSGAAQPRVACAIALTAWFGLLVGGGRPSWDAASAVMVVVTVAAWMVRREGVVPAALTTIGLFGAELGGGRMVRGALGTVDLACVAAIGAPLVIVVMDRFLKRRTKTGSSVGAVVSTAVLLCAAAWIVGRAV